MNESQNIKINCLRCFFGNIKTKKKSEKYSFTCIYKNIDDNLSLNAK